MMRLPRQGKPRRYEVIPVKLDPPLPVGLRRGRPLHVGPLAPALARVTTALAHQRLLPAAVAEAGAMGPRMGTAQNPGTPRTGEGSRGVRRRARGPGPPRRPGCDEPVFR